MRAKLEYCQGVPFLTCLLFWPYVKNHSKRTAEDTAYAELCVLWDKKDVRKV